MRQVNSSNFNNELSNLNPSIQLSLTETKQQLWRNKKLQRDNKRKQSEKSSLQDPLPSNALINNGEDFLQSHKDLCKKSYQSKQLAIRKLHVSHTVLPVVESHAQNPTSEKNDIPNYIEKSSGSQKKKKNTQQLKSLHSSSSKTSKSSLQRERAIYRAHLDQLSDGYISGLEISASAKNIFLLTTITMACLYSIGWMMSSIIVPLAEQRIYEESSLNQLLSTINEEIHQWVTTTPTDLNVHQSFFSGLRYDSAYLSQESLHNFASKLPLRILLVDGSFPHHCTQLDALFFQSDNINQDSPSTSPPPLNQNQNECSPAIPIENHVLSEDFTGKLLESLKKSLQTELAPFLSPTQQLLSPNSPVAEIVIESNIDKHKKKAKNSPNVSKYLKNRSTIESLEFPLVKAKEHIKIRFVNTQELANEPSFDMLLVHLHAIRSSLPYQFLNTFLKKIQGFGAPFDFAQLNPFLSDWPYAWLKHTPWGNLARSQNSDDIDKYFAQKGQKGQKEGLCPLPKKLNVESHTDALPLKEVFNLAKPNGRILVASSQAQTPGGFLNQVVSQRLGEYKIFRSLGINTPPLSQRKTRNVFENARYWQRKLDSSPPYIKRISDSLEAFNVQNIQNDVMANDALWIWKGNTPRKLAIQGATAKEDTGEIHIQTPKATSNSTFLTWRDLMGNVFAAMNELLLIQ